MEPLDLQEKSQMVSNSELLVRIYCLWKQLHLTMTFRQFVYHIHKFHYSDQFNMCSIEVSTYYN